MYSQNALVAGGCLGLGLARKIDDVIYFAATPVA